jgi:ribose transport system permease protein
VITDRVEIDHASLGSTLLKLVERYALIWLLGLMILFFSVLPATAGTFPTTTNIRNVVAQESVVGILALGALIPLVALQFDISVGAVLGGVAVVVAKLTVDSGWDLAPALAVGLAVGAAIGAVNGAAVAYGGANSFIVTLGIATLVGGLVSLYSDNQAIVGVPDSMLEFGNGTWLGIPRPTWLLIACALLVSYLLRYTVYGRRLTQVGSNPSSARLVGIRVRRVKLWAFVLAGLVAAIAGALQLARTGSGNPQVGPNLTLNALAACFLGSATIRPGEFNVGGTIVGVFFVAVMVNGLTLAGAADWVEPVCNGLAVVIAVTVSVALARRRGGKASVL